MTDVELNEFRTAIEKLERKIEALETQVWDHEAEIQYLKKQEDDY